MARTAGASASLHRRARANRRHKTQAPRGAVAGHGTAADLWHLGRRSRFEHRLAIEFNVDRTGVLGESLVHVPAPLDEPRLVFTHVRDRPESVELQFED